MDTRKVSALLLLAVLAVHCLHGLFPSPQLAFYVGRGWLGALAAWMLWRGYRISWPVAAVWALFEASTSVCGVLYVGMPAAWGGLCDTGTGLPVSLLSLSLAALALVGNEIHQNRGDHG